MMFRVSWTFIAALVGACALTACVTYVATKYDIQLVITEKVVRAPLDRRDSTAESESRIALAGGEGPKDSSAPPMGKGEGPRESSAPLAQSSLVKSVSDDANRPIKIAVVSVCVHVSDDVWGANLASWQEITSSNHRAYAAVHNYTYKLLEKRVGKGNARFLKGPWMLEVMQSEKFDWIFWTDCDALFMDFSIPLTRFIKPNINLIIAGDMNCAMNLGQLLFRDVPWVREMLLFSGKCDVEKDVCGNLCSLGNDQHLFNYFVWGDCQTSWGNFWDVKACNGVVSKAKPEYRAEIYCDPRLMNYPDQNQQELFRLHFAGNQQRKKNFVVKYAAVVKKIGPAGMAKQA